MYTPSLFLFCFQLLTPKQTTLKIKSTCDIFAIYPPPPCPYGGSVNDKDRWSYKWKKKKKGYCCTCQMKEGENEHD